MNKSIIPTIIWKSVFGVLIFLSFKANARDYFINDNDLTSDVYCTAVGVAGNDGLTPGTPKNSITSVLAAYGPSGDNTISSGDVFYIDAGLYFSLDLALAVNISNLSFIGAGSELTLFDNGPCGSCSGEFFMYITENDITIQGMTLTRYQQDAGNGGKSITVDGATGVVIDDVNMIAGIDNGDAALVVFSNSEVIFRNGAASCNNSNYGGGIQIEGSNITMLIDNCVIADNAKDLSFPGGGIYIPGVSNVNVTIQNCTITNNTASEGGGIWVQGATLTISNSCFESNSMFSTASNDGGGISVRDDSNVTITNCSFTNNTVVSSADGGGIGVEGQNTTVSITQCYFSGNTSSSQGDAIYANGTGGTNVSVFVDECIFAAGQTLYRTTDGFITVTNSGTQAALQESGSSALAGPFGPQTLGMPATNCPSAANPCQLTTLPVEFLDFTIACEGENTQFNWSTASERNNDYFFIEYSNDFINWNQVVREKGKGTTQLRSDYTLELGNAQSGYYKLSQVDYDGKENELKTAFIRNCANGFTVYPNPTRDEVTISLVGYDKNATIQVYNAVGVLVYENEVLIENELYSGRIDLRELSSGAYIIRAFDGLNNSQQKIIKN